MGGILLETENVQRFIPHALRSAQRFFGILGRELGTVDDIDNKFVFHIIYVLSDYSMITLV